MENTFQHHLTKLRDLINLARLAISKSSGCTHMEMETLLLRVFTMDSFLLEDQEKDNWLINNLGQDLMKNTNLYGMKVILTALDLKNGTIILDQVMEKET